MFHGTQVAFIAERPNWAELDWASLEVHTCQVQQGTLKYTYPDFACLELRIKDSQGHRWAWPLRGDKEKLYRTKYTQKLTFSKTGRNIRGNKTGHKEYKKISRTTKNLKHKRSPEPYPTISNHQDHIFYVSFSGLLALASVWPAETVSPPMGFMPLWTNWTNIIKMSPRQLWPFIYS